MNSGDDRPQGSRVEVGTGVKVGVNVGRRVAVVVACAVGDKFTGEAVPGGAPQPDRTARSRSQEKSFMDRRGVKREVVFMAV
jgi:hypothetical protein